MAKVVCGEFIAFCVRWGSLDCLQRFSFVSVFPELFYPGKTLTVRVDFWLWRADDGRLIGNSWKNT